MYRTRVDLKPFFDNNPLLYGSAGDDELRDIERIYALYPDSARLLGDTDVVPLQAFECRRCGACCSSVRYVPVSGDDMRRWLSQRRTDIISRLSIDRRRTPMLASLDKGLVEATKKESAELAEEALYDNGMPPVSLSAYRHAVETLYLSDLLENVVYAGRENGRCVFMSGEEGKAACSIQETKPAACARFPYYAGKYVDKKLLLKEFCPALKSI